MVQPSSASKGKKRAASPSRSAPAKKAKSADSSSSKDPTAFRSALVSEEVDFPRGGGSGLTPLEYKEVLGEARKEADADVAREGVADAKKSKKRRDDKKKGKEVKKKEEDGDHFRVEHLNYKRLSPGTPLLTRIHSIHPLHIVLSLPSQLYAHVPLTSISSLLTARLSASAEDSASDDDDDEAEADVPSLDELFTVGDWYGARVTKVYTQGESNPETLEGWKPRDSAERESRRVECSLDPKIVNEGFARVDLEKGFAITGAIKSVEDHGYTVDLGLDSFDGFLEFKSVGGNDKLEVGSLVKSVVEDVPEHGRNCKLSVEPKAVREACLTSVSNISSILPGALVSALVTAVIPNRGLNLSLLGFFTGSADLFHLPLSASSPAGLEKIKLGTKVKARVVYRTTNAADQEVRFGLSLKEAVVDLATDHVEKYEVGQMIESVRVVRVEGDWGLVVSISKGGPQGFVHISQVSDTHTPTLSATSGAYAPGTSHKARVVGTSLLDGLVNLALKPSVLEQTFLKVDDVKVGDVLKGTVKRLTPKALFVDVGGSVDGVAWPLHWADVMLRKAERRFKVGSAVKCRVLATEPEKNRVALTLKKSLLESELPIVADWDQAKVGVITDGVISKIVEKGAIIDLYGGLRAFVPISEASDSYIQNLADAHHIGKPVKIKITSVDPPLRKIGASIRQASQPSTDEPMEGDDDTLAAAPVASNLTDVEVGNVLSGTVTAVHAQHVLLTLIPSQAKALLSVANLANSQSISVDEAKKAVKLGSTLDNLVVVAKDEAKGLAFVSNKPKQAVKEKKEKREKLALEALDYDSLPVGEILPGRVLSHSHQGAIVLVGKSLKGRVNPTDLSDDFAAQSTFPDVGKVVRVAVLKVDPSSHIIDLSLRPSRTNPDREAKVIDKEIASIEDLEKGQVIRGFVKNISDGGLYVTLSRDVTARVMIRNLFDEFVKEWKPRFSLGQVVEGKILEINPMRNQVELTLKKKADVAREAKALGYGDFAVGQKVDAIVKKAEEYGIFLRIDDSNISGLCHKSQISDETKGDVGKALKGFREGDKVKAIILTLDPAARKIAFSIKPSHFADEDFVGSDDDESEEEGSDEDDDDDEDLQDKILQMIGAEEDSEHDDDAEEGEGSDGDMEEDVDEEDEDEADVIMLEDEAAAPKSKKIKALAKEAASGPALNLSGGFQWNATGEDDDEGSSDDVSDDENVAGPSTQAPVKKQKATKGIQQDFTGDLATKTPESTSDYERLLLSSPDSSFLWIQYMSFQLSMSEVQKAREVARRALKAISFREETEKLNVWLALLNLENSYGTEEEVEAIFKEAIQFNEPKTVHLRMAGIFEQTEKVERAEDILKRAAKKFSQSSKVWTIYGEYYFNRGDTEAARALLPRSLKSLPKRKHVKTITKFAQLEYRLGDAERGRTIFEGVVDSYPKRLDLWNVYIDLETKQGDIQSVRNLFTRALARKQSQKKAKSLFKKWMEIERRLAAPGDDSGPEMVKAKAIAFVQGQSAGADEGDYEEME